MWNMLNQRFVKTSPFGVVNEQGTFLKIEYTKIIYHENHSKATDGFCPCLKSLKQNYKNFEAMLRCICYLLPELLI